MNDNANGPSAGLDPEFVEMADFYRCVNECVVAWGNLSAGVMSRCDSIGVQLNRHLPPFRNIIK